MRVGDTVKFGRVRFKIIMLSNVYDGEQQYVPVDLPKKRVVNENTESDDEDEEEGGINRNGPRRGDDDDEEDVDAEEYDDEDEEEVAEDQQIGPVTRAITRDLRRPATQKRSQREPEDP